MLKIISAPSAVLSEIAKPILKIDKNVLAIIEEMKETLNVTHDPEGVGLAAPQIGKSLQIFIVKPTLKSRIQVFINPEIIAVSTTDTNTNNHKNQRESSLKSVEIPKKKSIKLEGCLSLPSIWGEVERSPKVLVSYLDEKGKKRERLFTGFTATILQHEYDHLQGTLFPKRVLEQKGKLYKSSKNKKGEDEFEEMEI